MVSLGTLVAFIVVSVSVPVMRRRAGAAASTASFRVPFGPYVVPTLSVLACIYIVKDLSTITFKVFAVWMIVAVSAFMIYRRVARRHTEA